VGISYRYNGKFKERARGLRKAGNLSEVLLWKELKDKKFHGLDFTRQAVIGNYIADFCCESKKIIVEVDGSSHIGREEYDAERDEFLTACGFQVIRVASENVRHNLDYVLRDISRHLKLLTE